MARYKVECRKERPKKKFMDQQQLPVPPIVTTRLQSQNFEREWEPHDPDFHPATLKLHVERRAKNAKELTFREMCGESAFVSESELNFVRKVGSGSFAQVHIAKYLAPGQPERVVAVKRLKSHAAVDVIQFASEANILRKLHHANIVEFIGVGSSDEGKTASKQSKSSCYMVQEFMNAGNLKQKIFKQGSVMHPIYSDHDAVQWARQIAKGLAYLHQANPVVLHRDLKLENILLHEHSPEGSNRPVITAKICDFGLSVSLLDPHFTYRQNDSLPSGLASPRIDSNFHRQMALSIQGSSTILDAKIAEQAAKFKSALTSNPGSPGSISRASSFLDGGFKSRLSDVNRLASMKEHLPLDHLQRSNSVSVAEVAHGRVRSPPNRAPTLKPKPRLAKTQTMSRVGQNLMETPTTPGAEPPVHGAYLLTGRAGSFLYMSPEVIMCQPYNEKADVFSLGVILFELFSRKTLAAMVLELDETPGSVEMFAYQVAGGYRCPLPQSWPSELRDLIGQCWAQDPDTRPHTSSIAKRLAELEDSEIFRKWETESQHSGGRTGTQACCTIQ